MRLQTTIDLFLGSDAIVRSPTLFERARRAFGAKLDLETDQARVVIEATALVDQVRAALKRMRVDNAVSLVIDDVVIYNDTDGKPDDLGDLMIALSEHAPVYGGQFRSVRFAAEHEEAGLHAIIEVHCLAQHAKDAPAATVHVSARIKDLEARPGEDAKAYRERVQPLVVDPRQLEVYRHTFESFGHRLTDALRATFPGGRIEEHAPEAKVVRPSAEGTEAPARRAPGHPAYDPYEHYYPSPYGGMLSGLLIGSFLSSAFAPPYVMVVHPSGAPIGPADQLAGHQADLAPDAPDPGAASDDALADSGGDDGYDGDGSDDYDGGDGGDDFGDMDGGFDV